MKKKEFKEVLRKLAKDRATLSERHGRALALLRYGEITVAQYDKIMVR
jgi:hypothetical protein